MRLYATTTDVWPTDAPADADTLVRAASRVVDVLLRGVVYDTDTDGMPTDTDVADSLKAAATAIAVDLEANGGLSASAGTEWDSVSIGNLSLSGRSTAGSAVMVGGIAVPAVALLELDAVGRAQVWVR